jgi:hypothetical protein
VNHLGHGLDVLGRAQRGFMRDQPIQRSAIYRQLYRVRVIERLSEFFRLGVCDPVTQSLQFPYGFVWPAIFIGLSDAAKLQHFLQLASKPGRSEVSPFILPEVRSQAVAGAIQKRLQGMRGEHHGHQVIVESTLRVSRRVLDLVADDTLKLFVEEKFPINGCSEHSVRRVASGP